MNEQIYSALEGLGLTRTEIAVYLELVKRGASTAYRISKEAQIYKANTYMAIESLVAKGFVFREEINGKQMLKAVQPEEFIKNIERQKEKLQAVLPEISRSFNEELEEVSVFTGVESLFNIFYSLLEQKQPIYVFDIPNYVPDIVKYHIDKFHKARIKKKVKMYHIYDYSAQDRIQYLTRMKYTYAKEGQKNRSSLVSPLVCGNTTLLINWKKNLRIVKIVDKDTADTFRHQFDILWENKK